MVDDTVKDLEFIKEFEGKPAEELFVALNAWMANNFVSAEIVIDYSDKDAGKIVGKHFCF